MDIQETEIPAWLRDGWYHSTFTPQKHIQEAIEQITDYANSCIGVLAAGRPYYWDDEHRAADHETSWDVLQLGIDRAQVLCPILQAELDRLSGDGHE